VLGLSRLLLMLGAARVSTHSRLITPRATELTAIGADLYPMPHPPSQSHSQVDLSQSANGHLDDSKLQPWDDNKLSADSNGTRSDGSRDSSWWRQMSSRRRTRDIRVCDAEGRTALKEVMPDHIPCNNETSAASPTAPSPGRKTTTGKIMSFFKRKPSNQREPEKQLSSFGSSSQLRTPPTSDPGRSLNSED
jgi:3',5'-cyclic-nucleotide phosphodiesterase